MNRLLAILVVLTWGVWLGGLVGVFLAVTSLNQTFADDRAAFAAGAGGVFHLFERVQLGLAAAALLLTFLWRLLKGAPALKTVVFAVFALGAVAAVVETTYITREITRLQRENQTRTPEFRKLHGMSMALYSGTLGVLAIGGALLIPTIARDGTGKARGSVE